MVWVTWRQHRVQLLTTVALFLALVVYMSVLGADAAALLGWLPVVPVLVGMFWGAPVLAREFEQGTHRLAWTQSVPRSRWVTAKLVLLGTVVTLLGLALGQAVTVWTSNVGADRFGDSALFGATGVVAGAWWLFAFLLGTATGGVIRRVLPALAVTLALFLVVLFGVFDARAGYAEPVRVVSDTPVAAGTLPTGAAWVSRSGEEVVDPPECAGVDRTTYLDCVGKAGYTEVQYFQPADRYWRFQWTETGILLLAAVLLTGPVVYRVMKRPV
ncbi:ABC transporter permease [Actinophytocola oryzae]|uniref:ABC-2 family transporter n=1 Tax=Actinophytocola oryzae TaxID=502181 RepID=A0A4R7UPX5_9PSEU|nr:ABC transporter permease [Actinophytocola oryzae]TDV34512.1 hypothetical protein CLV71_1395 [Actinophytocola oryzae]